MNPLYPRLNMPEYRLRRPWRFSFHQYKMDMWATPMYQTGFLDESNSVYDLWNEQLLGWNLNATGLVKWEVENDA